MLRTWMRPNFRKTRILFAALLIGGSMPVAASAGPSGQCTPAKVKFATDHTERSTTSTSFVNMAGTAVNFTQGGTTSSCVIVYFSAEAAASPGPTAVVIVRAELDGSSAGLPAETRFIYTATVYETHAASFIFPSVAPGSHSVRMQFRSSNGNTVYVHDRNTIVHYVP